MRALGLSAAAAIVLLGCIGPSEPQENCAAPALSILPSAPVLAIGDTLTLTASYSPLPGACAPEFPTGTLRWRSTDTLVAAVDSVSGVVTARADGRVNIYVHPAGTLQQLGAVRLYVFPPLFDRIVFTRVQSPCPLPAGCSAALWSTAPDGSDLRLLEDSLNWPEHPRVSPDGREVVYENWYALYIVDGAGRHRRRLVTRTAGGDYGFGPSWSPDGRWILFYAVPQGGTVFQVLLIHPDGTGLRQLTSGPLWSGYPEWSPDGSQIVFVRYGLDSSGSFFSEAVAMDSSGANPHVLTSGVAGFRGWYPSWAPDGASILFLDSVGSNWVIRRLDVGTSNYVLLGNAEGNRPGNWSPDGRLIVFGTGDLWLMDPDGANAHVVLPGDSVINFEAAWSPGSPNP